MFFKFQPAKLKQASTNLLNKIGNVNNFRQQRLPAWQPIITATSVIPTFVIVSICLIVIGAGFIYMSNYVKVFELDYTFCMPLYGTQSCAQILHDWRERLNSSWPPPECVCWYKFHLDENFGKNVYIYYSLNNYYQNHLHYTRSKDMDQFKGYATADEDCKPFRYRKVRVNGKLVEKSIVPCGTIANSLFNDTYTLSLRNDSWHVPIVKVPLYRTGIAWSVDYSRYRNPRDISIFKNFTNPPYWGNKTIWNLDPENPANNGLQNEALIVWLRTSAFPDFWKLYARVSHKVKPFKEWLPRGQYYLKIDYNYPITDFKGGKSFIIANTDDTLGGSYFFLGILYLIVGGLSLVAAFIMFLFHLKFAYKKEEYIEITQRTAYMSY